MNVCRDLLTDIFAASLVRIICWHPFASFLRYARGTLQFRRALKPLCGGYYFVLWGILGDLDYFHKALLLPRSTLASGPCSLCRCTGSGPLSWTDFRKTAGWRAVQWSAAAWRAWPDRSRSSLFEMRNFSPWLLALDWMHCKYLGCEIDPGPCSQGFCCEMIRFNKSAFTFEHFYFFSRKRWTRRFCPCFIVNCLWMFVIFLQRTGVSFFFELETICMRCSRKVPSCFLASPGCHWFDTRQQAHSRWRFNQRTALVADLDVEQKPHERMNVFSHWCSHSPPEKR